MTHEERRAEQDRIDGLSMAVAIALGWEKPAPDEPGRPAYMVFWQPLASVEQGRRRHWGFIPRYGEDLDAMHEAEKALPGSGSLWLAELASVVGFKHPVPCGSEEYDVMLVKVARATAAQRAEAFLRVVGKWEGEP